MLTGFWEIWLDMFTVFSIIGLVLIVFVDVNNKVKFIDLLQVFIFSAFVTAVIVILYLWGQYVGSIVKLIVGLIFIIISGGIAVGSFIEMIESIKKRKLASAFGYMLWAIMAAAQTALLFWLLLEPGIFNEPIDTSDYYDLP